MTAWGLKGTSLVVRETPQKSDLRKKKANESAIGEPNSRTISGKELETLIKLLSDMERIVGVLTRRGIHFLEFVQKYYDGKTLPSYMIRIEGREEVYHDSASYEKRLDELGEQRNGQPKADASDQPPSVMAEELHEVARLNQINEILRRDFQLDMADFLLKEQRAVSGEVMPMKFRMASGEDTHDLASLGDVCPAVRQVGGKGVEIKRFKGLGEMNAEQLWETTMNPATRTLLSVRLDDAGEADRLFTILMGDDVEQRRDFIREHALEVQYLDI
jgi:DNA gyrase subunit B